MKSYHNLSTFTFQVLPYSDSVHRAVRIGVPSIQAQLKTVLRNQTGGIIDSRLFNMDLTKGEFDFMLRPYIISTIRCNH